MRVFRKLVAKLSCHLEHCCSGMLASVMVIFWKDCVWGWCFCHGFWLKPPWLFIHPPYCLDVAIFYWVISVVVVVIDVFRIDWFLWTSGLVTSTPPIFFANSLAFCFWLQDSCLIHTQPMTLELGLQVTFRAFTALDTLLAFISFYSL